MLSQIGNVEASHGEPKVHSHFYFFASHSFLSVTGLDCFYGALLWAGPCHATSLLGAVGESLPQGVRKQKLAGLGMGLSHIAGGDLAMERYFGESQELAFSLVQPKPAPACSQDKLHYCRSRGKRRDEGRQSCNGGYVFLRALHVPECVSLVGACMGTWHPGGVPSGGTTRP